MKRNHTHFSTTLGALVLALLMLVAVSPAASAAGPLFHNRSYPEFRMQAVLPEPTIEGLAAANAYETLLEKYGGFGVETFANAAYVAADLLSQAEHGPDSQVMLVTTSLDLAYKVKGEIDNECAFLSRSLIARQALTESSILIVNSIDEAIAISNTYAPEHLILQIKDAEKYLNAIRNAGSIFVGAYTPESLGDYASGTNHTLPTYGYARTYSALGTDDFRRRYTLQRATKEGLEKIASTITTLAKAEGLDAHGYAVTVRLEK